MFAFAAACVFSALLLGLLGPWAGALWRWRHVPGPLPLPLAGNTLAIVREGLQMYLLRFALKYKGQHSVFKAFLGPRMLLVLLAPEDARVVALKSNTRMLQRPLNVTNEPDDVNMLDGLVGANGPVWRTLRLAWQPAFSSSSLQGYAALMDSSARKLAALMEAAADEGRVVDIHLELGNMTLDVVGTTALGVDFHALPDPHGREQDRQGRTLVDAAAQIFFYSTLSNASVYMRLAAFLPWASPLWLALAKAFPDAPLLKLTEARLVLKRTSYGLISSWRGTRACDAACDPAPSPKQRMNVAPGSFLGLLLAARSQETGERLSDKQIAAQSNTFILAGYETTANALAFAIFCLAANPRAQAAMLAELDAWQDAFPEQAPAEAELPYAMAVIQEALRLFPPASAISRAIDKPGGITLPSCGLHIPQGTTVIIPTFAYHHDPEYWPRVEEFLPERWLEEGASTLGPSVSESLVFLPWGGGARACVGFRFALQEAKIALARLYTRLTFVLEPGQVPLMLRQGITMGPKHGVLVRAVRRR